LNLKGFSRLRRKFSRDSVEQLAPFRRILRGCQMPIQTPE